MASDKFMTLLRALKKGTDNKKVCWEDLPDDEMFRAQAGGGFVRIGTSALASTTRKGYSLWLIGLDGAIVAEIDYFPDDQGYGLIEDLYQTARLVARGGDQMVDSIIRQLNPAEA